MVGNTKHKNQKKSSIDWHEINRKIFHIIGGLMLCALLYIDFIKLWMVIATLGIGIIISMLYKYYDIPIIDFFLKKFERKHLRKTFPGKGVLFLFLALLVMMISFDDKNIIISGMLIWTFGDSISAIVGKHYGTIRHPFNDKRIIEGTVAGIIAAAIAASFFTYWLYALIASTIAMIIESTEWKLYHDTLDDNFFVPVIGSFAIYLLILIF